MHLLYHKNRALLATAGVGWIVTRRRPVLSRGRHFEDVVILLCVRWYRRYSLTYRDLEEIILRCLAKKPGERFQTVKALGEALAACASAGDWGPKQADAWWATVGEKTLEGAADAPA